MARPSTLRFARDTAGVSAVEFALILPVTLLLLLGGFEVTRAVTVNSKLALLSRTVSDLISQDEAVTLTELQNIVKASKSVIYPYSDAPAVLKIDVESIRKNDQGNYIIDWSYAPNAQGAMTINSQDRASSFTPPEPSVVRTKVRYTYNLVFVKFLLERLKLSTINLLSTTYMSPRTGLPVRYDAS